MRGEVAELIRAVATGAPDVPQGLVGYALSGTSPVQSYAADVLLRARGSDLDIETLEKLFAARCATREPSSPALAQVIARRISTGQPVVKVLEDLLSGLEIGPMGFTLPFTHLRRLPVWSQVHDAVLNADRTDWLTVLARSGGDFHQILTRVSDLWDQVRNGGTIAGADTPEDAEKSVVRVGQAVVNCYHRVKEPPTGPYTRRLPVEDVALWGQVRSDELVYRIATGLPSDQRGAEGPRLVESWVSGRLTGSGPAGTARASARLVDTWPDAELVRVFRALDNPGPLVGSTATWKLVAGDVAREYNIRFPTTTVFTVHDFLGEGRNVQAVEWLLDNLPDSATAWEALVGMWPQAPVDQQVTVQDVVAAVREAVRPVNPT